MNILNMNKVDIIVTKEKESEMVSFYQNVFEMKFTSHDIQGHTFYDGKISNLFNIRFVPADFVQIRLERNRMQLNFTVENLDIIIHASLENGGIQSGEIIKDNSGNRVFSVIDPDGNYIVLSGK
jgi:predicted enzyme related to lactoylglutathione lyase